MSILRISRQIEESEPDLSSRILCSFGSYIDITTIGDVANQQRAYLLSDRRISKESKSVDVLVSTSGIPDSLNTNAYQLLFQDFETKLSVFFSDGTIEEKFKETKTASELRKSIDFQLEELSKHENELCRSIVKSLIGDLVARLVAIESK